jgi:hypothetical protein
MSMDVLTFRSAAVLWVSCLSMLSFHGVLFFQNLVISNPGELGLVKTNKFLIHSDPLSSYLLTYIRMKGRVGLHFVKFVNQRIIQS